MRDAIDDPPIERPGDDEFDGPAYSNEYDLVAAEECELLAFELAERQRPWISWEDAWD